MTTVNQATGRIIWSLESKLFLLKLIKENMIILSSDVSAETMAQKEMAWKIIEKSFAEDGMLCQLDKIKRLWKRMKESTRHTVKQINLQKRRRVKNVKVLSQLDNEILKFITINEDEVSSRKAKQKPKARKYVRTKAAKKEIITDQFEYNQHTYYNNTENQTIHDSYFEPVTILEEEEEEYEQKPSTEIISESIIEIDPFTVHNNNNNDDGHSDYENFINELNITNINYKNKAQQQKTTTTTTTTTTTNLANDGKRMESELLLADLKYKQSLRDNEIERMEYDRELYRKKIILLDLQIKKTNLELSRLV